ncbi:helix-turn-helix domain-containing protein [Robertmurraya massiliosenegalensis]|uniref:PucR family transcriptional regulator n=1 Tax=Robertmurraya TaxID=2837507 RepID=UPI0039A63275
MSVVKEDIYQLVDGTLDNGLPYVGSYLEKTLGRQIIVTDCRGFIHYPYILPNMKQIDDSFITLPNLTQNDYLYSKTEKCLYYRIICSYSNAYIIVRNLPATQVPLVLSILKQAKLAVKCYFSQMNQTKNDHVVFEQEMYEYLFGQSTANITDILALGNYQLAADHAYFVVVMEVKDVKNSKQWTAIMSYSREFLKRIAPEAFMISCPQLGMAVYIFPDGSKAVGIEPFKTALEKNYHVAASFGRGKPHSLYHLRRSCEEARIALHYPLVMGTKAEIQSFSDLGTFTPLFSQDLDVIKIFCQNTLEPLCNYDKKNEGCLLTTLTELVNSNFNLKETAKNLFIHVNTLYYRIHKIEQLLSVELSLISTRFNLYTALMSWSLLHMSGLWDWASELRQDLHKN